MAALSGEPFRGLSVVRLTETLNTANRRSYTCSIVDVVPDTATGDQATWEGNPGTSVTLRFEWDTAGTPGAGLPQATEAQIQTNLPGGGSFGTVWTVFISGDSGSATRTYHFDDDPLSATSGTARWGSIELFMVVAKATVATWTADSRGGGSPPAGNTHDWARGYLRAPGILSSHSISNVAIAGAEPGSWAFPDPVHTRITMDSAAYESNTIKLGLRSAADAEERNSSLSGTAANKDYSWTGTAGTNGANRIAEGMTLAAEAKDLRVDITAADFGGDNKYVFATTGHQAGWTRVSELVLQDDDRITVDPRLTWSYHMQFDANDFATPPTSHANTAPNNERLTSQLAFIACRIVNARSEGQNSITFTRSLRDATTLVADEAGDSVVTATKGGEAGWAPSFITWDAALPGGTWNQTQTLTAPADATDLDTNPTKALSLLAADPRVSVQGSGGPGTRNGSHPVAGDTFTIGLGAVNVGTQKRINADSDGAGGHKAYCALVKMEDTGANSGFSHYLDSDGTTWVPIDQDSDTVYFHQAAETRSGSAAYTKTFTTTQTAGWSTYAVAVIPKMVIGGVPYGPGVGDVVQLSGDLNGHNITTVAGWEQIG